MSADQARRALRELDRLKAHLVSTMRAAAVAGLDAGPLGSMLSQLDAYTRKARTELNWPPPLHPRCGQRHFDSEPCPKP